MKKKSILILSTLISTAILSYILLNNLILSFSLLTLGVLLFYIAQRNNRDRKENLNIIRDEEKLYFYLSDDLLFSVNLTYNQNISDIIRDAIQKEMVTLQTITRKICFINFKNQPLLNELNHSLKN